MMHGFITGDRGPGSHNGLQLESITTMGARRRYRPTVLMSCEMTDMAGHDRHAPAPIPMLPIVATSLGQVSK